MHILLIPCPFNPKFENVPLTLHYPNFVGEKPQQRANYLSKKFSPITKCLATIHPLWTERQKDDNGTINVYRIAVVLQRIVYSIGLIINVRERKFQRMKVLPTKLLFPGMKVLGYKSSSYLLYDSLELSQSFQNQVFHSTSLLKLLIKHDPK